MQPGEYLENMWNILKINNLSVQTRRGSPCNAALGRCQAPFLKILCRQNIAIQNAYFQGLWHVYLPISLALSTCGVFTIGSAD